MVKAGRRAGPSGSLHRLPISSNGTKGNRGEGKQEILIVESQKKFHVP